MRTKNPNITEMGLITIGVIDFSVEDSHLRRVKDVVESIQSDFRFVEILLIVEGEPDVSLGMLELEVPGMVRLIQVASFVDSLGKREVIADEALGDIVVVSTIDELQYAILKPLIENTKEAGSITVAQCVGERIFGRITRASAKIAGFRLDSRDVGVMCYPRVLLAKLLRRQDKTLALRFIPLDRQYPVDAHQTYSEAREKKRTASALRRLWMSHQLLAYFAPIVLFGVTILAGVTVVSTVSYITYAGLIFVFSDNIEPGWFSITITSSLFFTFAALILLSLTIGIQRLLQLVEEKDFNPIVAERSSGDLFSLAQADLNIVANSDATTANDAIGRSIAE